MKGHNGLELADDFGAEFTRMLSSAKLVPSQAAARWHLDEAHIRAVMEGHQAPSRELEEAILRYAPLNLGDLYRPEVRHRFPVLDDTIAGVVVFPARDSDATRRPLFRTQSPGVKFVVYDYADTAVSRVSRSNIIPERIWENIIVDQTSSERVPGWAFNQGHFEQQMTYFIGKVTVYFRDLSGRVHPVDMNTGDMEYHVPFVPHLFTKRDESEGLILAVTYRGEVGTREFLDSIKSMPEDKYMARIRRQLQGIEKKVIEKGQLSTGDSGFVVNRYGGYRAARTIAQGPYQIKTLLSGVPFQPDTLGLEYTMSAKTRKKEFDIRVAAERWGYVRGESPVTLRWPGHEEILEPDSSFFIKAGVSHSLQVKAGYEKYGRVLVMQVKPQQEDPWNTLALALRYAGEEGVQRARKETKQWSR